MKKSAFTLIELLVVIAIIAVLASIALPVFGRVMEKGKAVQDASNLRQIGIATRAYLNDKDDQLFSTDPIWQKALGSHPTDATYGNYLMDWKAFFSPFDKRGTQASGHPYYVSFGLNPNVVSRGNSSGSSNYKGNLSDWVSPSQTILFAPRYDYAAGPDLSTSWTGKSNEAAELPTPSGTKKGTHSNGSRINVLFGDMHVETILWTDFARSTGSTTSDADKYRWNPTGSGS